MHKAEWTALIISLVGVAAGFLVAVRVFEAVPHVEDEMAYVWQAQVFAHGHLTVPTPRFPQNMQVPFVVDANGQRFAKYPPGWPMVLALGLLLGIRTWVNPLLGGLAIWLTFRLGQKVFGTATGLLAALLTLVSPFFLVISGSLDSESWSLVLTLSFLIAWVDSFDLGHVSMPTGEKHSLRWMSVSVAGLSLGLLILTRPLTALAVALPFFLHGLLLLWRGDSGVRLRVLAIGLISLLVGSLFLAWQYKMTGNPFTNLYTLWWSFDRVGFGPGIGLEPGGHNLYFGLQNTKALIIDTNKDLFGWGNFSWLFLPFGLWAVRRNRATWLLTGIFISLMVAYVFYWASALHYGPRYYYEGIFALTLVSAAGILWLAGSFRAKGWRRLRVGLVGLVLTGLLSYNLAVYLPARFEQIYGLYGIHPSQLSPFLTAQARSKTPALVLVHVQKSWVEYASLLELEDPWLTTPFIFAWSNNGSVSDADLAKQYPNRRAIYYYPDEPDKFYNAPR
jgi:4-amino-4-deoxy-L-arabinose transferase-like glycosyltransferase